MPTATSTRNPISRWQPYWNNLRRRKAVVAVAMKTCVLRSNRALEQSQHHATSSKSPKARNKQKDKNKQETLALECL